MATVWLTNVDTQHILPLGKIPLVIYLSLCSCRTKVNSPTQTQHQSNLSTDIAGHNQK